MDLTPSKCQRNGPFLSFSSIFRTANQHFPLKSPLGHPWDPRAPASSQIPFREYPDCFQISQIALAYTRILRGTPPKWFMAIICAIWLRLIFPGRGSAWFFGAHLLFFHARGRILEAGVRFSNPEVDILARGRFLVDLESQKTYCCRGMFCSEDSEDSILPK